LLLEIGIGRGEIPRQCSLNWKEGRKENLQDDDEEKLLLM
jgi:hypothetical protein